MLGRREESSVEGRGKRRKKAWELRWNERKEVGCSLGQERP